MHVQGGGDCCAVFYRWVCWVILFNCCCHCGITAPQHHIPVRSIYEGIITLKGNMYGEYRTSTYDTRAGIIAEYDELETTEREKSTRKVNVYILQCHKVPCKNDKQEGQPSRRNGDFPKYRAPACRTERPLLARNLTNPLLVV